MAKHDDMTGSVSTAEQLMTRVKALGPSLAANGPEGEAERRVPEESIQALKDAGVFKVMVSKRYGGCESSIRSLMEIGAAVAEGDGGTGWMATLTGVFAWMVGLYSGKAQDEVFGADPDAIVCGSRFPVGTGTRVEGGWLVSGRWPYISGSLHASWAVLGFLATDQGGQVVGPALALIPLSELVLTDTWFTTGMRASGSNTLSAEGVFIPDHRVLSNVRGMVGTYATEYQDEIPYRAALFPTLTAVLVAPLLGVGRAALEYARKAAGSKGIATTTYTRQADSAAFQLQLAEAAMRVDTAHLHAFRAADDIDAYAARGAHPDVLIRARIRADSAHAAQEVVGALTMLLNAHGSGGFAESSPLHRMWQDANMGARHGLLTPGSSYEIYGRALLDMPIDITPAI